MKNGPDMAMSGGGTSADMAMMVTPLKFTTDIEPDIDSLGCTGAACHDTQTPKITADANANYTNIQAVIDTANPAASTLLVKLDGEASHTGGPKLGSKGSATYNKWLSWISQGAPK